MKNKIYPREGDRQTVYLKEVVCDPNIEVGEWTIYNDFAADPVDFERNNVLYHYPVNGDRLVIGKFCSLACGARFLFNSANHTLKSLSTYPFPIFWGEEWGIDKSEVASAWATTTFSAYSRLQRTAALNGLFLKTMILSRTESMTSQEVWHTLKPIFNTKETKS